MNRLLLLVVLFSLHVQGQQLAKSTMDSIYREVQTPYKYGLVVTPAGLDKKIDCPQVFRHGRKWYMVYIQFDGRGYETWLSSSKDLLHWKSLGRMMSFSKDSTEWDANQKAGYIALQDQSWNGSYAWKKYDGKYWMSYFGGKEKGYEQGPLALGMAYTNRKPWKAHEWTRLNQPVQTAQDKDARWWENRKQFKSTVIEDSARLTGHRFVMYYNANGDSLADNKPTRWFERIGMNVSDDLMHWQRYLNDPVMHHPVGITGDPVIQKMNNIYVMFYFGAFWKDREGAFNRFAASSDLVHWTDWSGESLSNSSIPIDAKYAHKSFVVKHDGVVYHFYCAVDKKDNRGIAVATSTDLGQSTLEFPKK